MTFRMTMVSFFLLGILAGACSNNDKQILMEATISDIHEALRAGDLTCGEVVEFYLARIEAYDQPSGLNSIVVTNDQAQARAGKLEKQYAETDEWPSLYCIPVIVKDNYLTKGLQTTAGSVALKGFKPKRDAYQVRRLKEAGAIVLAKSNMAEWAFSPKVTISSTAGETRNPYDLSRVPAGSSGGTAAAVAANLGAVGLGSDTGNSIRGPSSHTALVGFRTTMGLTSRDGIAPLYLRNDVGGPMTRTVEDATRILEVIAGHDAHDALTKHSEGNIPDSYLKFLDENGLEGERIGVLRELSNRDPHPGIDSLFEKAILDLEELGAEIVDPFEVADFDSLSEGQWCSVFKHDINNFLTSLDGDVPISSIEEVVASGQYSDYIEERLQFFMENPQEPQEDDLSCRGPFEDPKRIAFREAIEKAMDKHNVGAIIYPTWNHPPAKIGNLDGYKGDNSQIIAPHTGQPAFTIPMGYTKNGNLPAGLQFVGRMFDEPTLIQYLYAYEQGTKHRKPPSDFPLLQNQK